MRPGIEEQLDIARASELRRVRSRPRLIAYNVLLERKARIPVLANPWSRTVDSISSHVLSYNVCRGLLSSASEKHSLLDQEPSSVQSASPLRNDLECDGTLSLAIEYLFPES